MNKLVSNVVNLTNKLGLKLCMLLCHYGFHKYLGKPILASLDSYWMQSGEGCVRCKVHKISFSEAAILVKFAYERGKQDSEVKLMAYGNGVKNTIALYGKDYVQKILNESLNINTRQ